MITVGFGDIFATNYIEASFLVVLMFISCGVFAYSFNQIGQIINQYEAQDDELNKETELINKVLEKKNIQNSDLRLQVKKFMEYKFQNEINNVTIEQENYVIQSLSQNLRHNFILECNFQYIKKFPEFFQKFSREFQEKICLKFIQKNFTKNEVIFEEEQQQINPCLYFIETGKVSIFIENLKDNTGDELIILKKLSKGQFFGELSFITTKY